MSRIGAIKAIKNSILKVMAPAHLMGTVPVIANGGSGAQPGPCLSVKKGGIALHGATRETVTSVTPGKVSPAAANSPQNAILADRREGGPKETQALARTTNCLDPALHCNRRKVPRFRPGAVSPCSV